MQHCNLDYGRLSGRLFDNSAAGLSVLKRALLGKYKRPLANRFRTGRRESVTGTVLLKPVWRARALSNHSLGGPLAYSPHIVILRNPGPGLPEAIEARFANSKCISLQASHGDSKERFLGWSLQIFDQIRKILNERPGRALMQVRRRFRRFRCVVSGTLRFTDDRSPGDPGFRAQLIEVERMDSTVGLISDLEECLRCPEDVCIRYENGRRLISAWEEVPYANHTGDRRPWKNGGVYLITGGAGRLGLIFAKEIASQISSSKVILAGRSEPPDADRTNMEQLAAFGATVQYRRADVGCRKEVEDLVRGIFRDFGTIDGIVHGAGIHRDHLILNKPAGEIEAVFSPKVSGVVYLDEATTHMALDFFVCFSSCAAVLGNPGQADYAAANAFMDAYMRDRDRLVASGKRHGRSLSINWPLWKEGGMQIDAVSADTMRESLGMGAMDTKRGICAFYGAWNSGQSQILVVDGEPGLIRRRLLSDPSEPAASSPGRRSPAATPTLLFAETEQRLKEILAEVIDAPSHRIDAEEPLEEYGIDSLMIATLNKKLGEIFSEVSRTLFFEFRTLASIARYLVETCPEVCAAWSERQNQTQLLSHSPAAAELPASSHLPKTESFPSRRLAREPIAIIGIDGRYPQARNLEAYWKQSQIRQGLCD